MYVEFFSYYARYFVKIIKASQKFNYARIVANFDDIYEISDIHYLLAFTYIFLN